MPRIALCLLLAASATSCGPLRGGEPEERVIALGEEYHGAKERLVAAGAIELTHLAAFYNGLSPYSIAKRKDGAVIVTSHLLVYSGQPSGEIRGWFLLPDNTCVSLFIREGNAARIAAIELGEQGKGFQPPPKTVLPQNLSPIVEPDRGNAGEPVTIEMEERPPDLSFWSRQVRRTVDRLRLDDHSDPGASGSTLSTGMPFRLAAAILAAHAADDHSGGVSFVPMASYVQGKHPRTLPVNKIFVLPGNTLVVLLGTYNPLAREQFTVDRLVIGAPGFGYPGGSQTFDQEFTEPRTQNLGELVRRAGELHLAAQTGDLDAVHRILREKPDALNSRDWHNATPLHAAVKRGKREVARALLRAGADVQAADGDGDTPLIVAASLGRPDIASLLLGHGARAKVVNKRGDSPFLIAGTRGDLVTVARLLDEYQVDVNQADEADFTLLHRAAGRANPELTRILLKHGANLELLRGGNNITPLYDAILAGSVEVVRLLLDAGARVEPTRKGEYRPLDGVASNGSVEIARMLLARGVKPDGRALYEASNCGHGPLVKLFLDHGADLNYRDDSWKRTALHTARSADVVRVLLRAGMDIEVKNESGETPLHEAAEFAPLEVVVALLELGADPHAVSDQNQTPFDTASGRDRPEKAEVLQTLRAAMSKVRPKKGPNDKK